MKQDLAPEFFRNQEKVISILTETHINHTAYHIQYSIKEIIDWVPSFSLLEIVTQKGCFFCFIWVLKVPEVDTDPKGRFLSFKVTPSNESSLLVPLQGIAPENSWLGALFGRTTQNQMQNKNEGSENKIMLGDVNCAMDKIDRDGENKT